MVRTSLISSFRLVLLAVVCVLGSRPAIALDLRHATVFIPATASGPEKKAGAMFVDEVAKRTRLTLPVSSQWPGEGNPVIAIGVGAQPAGVPALYVDALLPPAAGSEGYRVQTIRNAIVIAGNSPVAAVFGVGYLLRHLRMEADPMKNVAILEAVEDFRVSTSPHHGIRGFQFNYRDWTNSYDGWTPALFEQYVRDVAVFGGNAIELMGPGPDNDRESPHFPLAKIDMLVEMSRITAEYGLQVWIFFPAWGSVPRGASPIVKNYADPKDMQDTLDEWGEVFRRMPRLDAVFVPGGDPGYTRPKDLMGLLGKQTANLRHYHPDAQMWVSPQEFNQEWMEEFLAILKTEPAWLTGVVYGPWTRLSLPELRERVPARYPIRLYPDIAHSTYCEYPVRDWDLALMITNGREPSNPRPIDMARIFHYADKYNVGTLNYSEGINDDVNKFIFTVLDWDPATDVKQILREYARYFLGPRLEEAGADGILALEKNWQGPLLTNGGVDRTFAQFRTLEQSASPQLLANWRFQHLLYRAYYDYYVKTRLIYETSLQQQAMEALREAGTMGSLVAMNEATRILTQAVTRPIGRDLRERLHELAAAMFQSIRSQLSVDRYKARSVDRGASLDSAETPLNERYWLENRFAEIRKVADEPTRLAEIDKLLNRANPGPGGFYDDLGNPTNQSHLEGVLPFEEDPGLFHSPHNAPVIFESAPLRSIDAVRSDGPAQYLSYPMAWWTYEETRWETPLSLYYPNLDRAARYKVRIVYYGWSKGDARIKLVANGNFEIHPYLKKSPHFSELEFDIPPQATAKGELRLQWQAEPGGRWPGVMVNEVFLIRQ
jgi:hypothetical protein